MPSLEGKVAIVTGAGRGIGRETARLLAAGGYAVLVTDMNEDAARETAEMLGEPAWHMRHDVRDASDDERLAERRDGARWWQRDGITPLGSRDRRWRNRDDRSAVSLTPDVRGQGRNGIARPALDQEPADAGRERAAHRRSHRREPKRRIPPDRRQQESRDLAHWFS